jgi:hypothetical protein
MIEHSRLDASIDEIECALNMLVGEIVTLTKTLTPGSFAGLTQSPYARSGPPLTRIKIAMDLIASSPIDGALRFSVTQIGEHLFQILQSPDKMMRIARRVCSEDEANWSRRMTVIDAAWEGIGSKDTGYWS